MSVIEITNFNFEKEVLGCSLPFILDVSATWCVPCRKFEPVFAEVACEMSGSAAFGRVEIDGNPEMPRKLGVTNVPTLLIFKEGRQIDAHAGAMTKEKFVKKLKKAI